MRPADLLPHAGAMVLLDRVLCWDQDSATCAVLAHLDPANPLRRDHALPAICGVEFMLQTAAMHGALRGGGSTPRGYLAVLRDVELLVDRLDDPALGELRARATLVSEESGGVIYDLELHAANGARLLQGRAVIAWPKTP